MAFPVTEKQQSHLAEYFWKTREHIFLLFFFYFVVMKDKFVEYDLEEMEADPLAQLRFTFYCVY